MFGIREFNQAILELAPRYIARPIAPGTFRDTMACHAAGSVVVWDGASEQTIYGDARVNHAFRAWHDACHVAGEFDFTLNGERATCERQISALRNRFPRVPIPFIELIRAEVTGQAEHFAATGMFPADQAAFIRSYIAKEYRP